MEKEKVFIQQKENTLCLPTKEALSLNLNLVEIFDLKVVAHQTLSPSLSFNHYMQFKKFTLTFLEILQNYAMHLTKNDMDIIHYTSIRKEYA